MSDSQCGICGESLDGDHDETLCTLNAAKAFFHKLASPDAEKLFSLRLIPAEISIQFESIVGIPDADPERRWRGYITITTRRSGIIIRQVCFGSPESHSTPEGAADACDEIYEQFKEFYSSHGFHFDDDGLAQPQGKDFN